MLLFGVIIDLAVRVIIEPYNDLKELSLLLIIIVRVITDLAVFNGWLADASFYMGASSTQDWERILFASKECWL